MVLQPNFERGKVAKFMERAKHKTVGNVLRKKAFLTPERIALEWENTTLTFRELNEQVNRIANSFLNIGIERGQRISVLTQNRLECSHILYAAAKIGAIVSFLNWRYTDQELVEAINVITPETIIVSDDYVDKVNAVKDQIPYLKRIILLDEQSEQQGEMYHQFAQLLNDGANVEPEIELHEEDALFIVYTSGTTGVPKGATISHRSEIQRIFAQMATFPTLLNVNKDDVYIARGPFFHVNSIDQMFATHAMGGKVIILAGYDPEKIVDILERESVGWLAMSPGMFDQLIETVKRRNPKIKSVKAVGSMADIIPKETIAEITRLLNAPFFNTYGLTEIGMHNFSQNVLPIADENTQYKSMAKAEGIFCDIRLVNSEGNDVPDGEPGELIIRTPMIFSGYWDNEAENEKVFRDGWFRTGDVLRRNPDGTLDFVSRTKYMIKSGGENIYPAEIERILLSHPQIQEAVVVRAKHPKWGETPVAFVAAKEPLEEDYLKQFCIDNGLSRYKVPNVIELVEYEKIPRNSNGKVLVNEVEQWVSTIEHRIS